MTPRLLCTGESCLIPKMKCIRIYHKTCRPPDPDLLAQSIRMESKKISETFTSSKTVVRQENSKTTLASSSNITTRNMEVEGTPPPRPPPPKYGEVAYGVDHLQAACGPVTIFHFMILFIMLNCSGEERRGGG